MNVLLLSFSQSIFNVMKYIWDLLGTHGGSKWAQFRFRDIAI